MITWTQQIILLLVRRLQSLSCIWTNLLHGLGGGHGPVCDQRCTAPDPRSPAQLWHHVEAGADNIDLVKCLHFIKKSFNFGSALPRLERQAADMPPSLIGPNEALYLNQNIRLTRMIRRMLLLSIMWQLGGYQRTKERFVEYKIRSVDFSIIQWCLPLPERCLLGSKCFECNIKKYIWNILWIFLNP